MTGQTSPRQFEAELRSVLRGCRTAWVLGLAMACVAMAKGAVYSPKLFYVDATSAVILSRSIEYVQSVVDAMASQDFHHRSSCNGRRQKI